MEREVDFDNLRIWDLFDLVLRNIGMLHELLFAAQASCSLWFGMRCFKV